MKRIAIVLLAACSSDPVEKPSPTPPPTWGVPISGGTLLVSRSGAHAVIADPDRDRIVTVDLKNAEVVSEIALDPNDEPGRLVEDGAGRIHVALRHGGVLFTMDSPTAETGTRREACGEPRGLAWQASSDLVHVACSGGELVSFPAAGGAAVRTTRLDRDLRDVIVDGDTLHVSRFRTAELLTLDASGAIVARATSPIVKRTVTRMECPECGDGGVATETEPQIVDAVPAVAWRTLALADGAIVVSHQRQVKGKMKPEPDGYGVGCGGGPVEHALTVMRPGQAPFAVQRVSRGALPVDAAVSPDGTRIAFVMAGSRRIDEITVADLQRPDRGEDDCKGDIARSTQIDQGLPTSIAFTPNNELVTFYPEAPSLVVGQRIIKLTGEFGYDAGRAMFHDQTRSGLACASCHPEGRDDGLVWTFESIGPRRTQNLAGGVLARAPFHWNADMANLDQLMTEVFSQRMSGTATQSARESLGPWLDRIPAPKGVVTDVAAVERGRGLFDSTSVGCATCHSGSQLTNNLRADFGKGPIKVPSLLGVGARAPFMHDGCAATLRDRFGACGGGDLHGVTSQLTPAQIGDLVAYLESL